jgi:hypothetical protein
MPKFWTVALAIATLGAGGASAYGGSTGGFDKLNGATDGTVSAFAATVSPQLSVAQPQLSAASPGASFPDKRADALSATNALQALSAGINLESARGSASAVSDKADLDSPVMRSAASLLANAPTVSLSAPSLVFDTVGLGQTNLQPLATGSGIPALGGSR